MKRAVALSLLAALGLAASLAHAQSGTGKIQIFTSRDTSFITKPLRADGTVDYVAALDAERRHGLKPDENAAIGLIRALAFLESGSEGLAYKLLNMTPPEPGARHFVELEAYVASSSPATQDANQFTRQRGEQLAKAMSAPWTQDQLPLIAGWLSVNEQPLNQVAAATTMPGFYLPLIYSADPPSVADAKPPRVGVLRSAAMALRARAFLRLGEGNEKGATSDMRAIHRLARLLAGQGALISEHVAAGNIDSMACEGDCLMVGSKKLTPAACRLTLTALRALTALPPIADSINTGERFLALDSTYSCARGDLPRFARTFLGADLPADQAYHVDWNVTLRTVNAWYDRVVATLQQKDPVQRRKAAQELTAELAALQQWSKGEGLARLRELAAVDTRGDSELRTEKSDIFGKMIVSVFMKRPDALAEFQDKTAAALDLDRTVMALEVARVDLGHYPQKLDELSPKYLFTVPKDFFSGQPLLYRLDPKGYTLYSVGPNGKDDGGRGASDGGDPPGDDNVVHMD